LDVLDEVEVSVDYVLDRLVRDQWVCGPIVDNVCFVAVEDLSNSLDVG